MRLSDVLSLPKQVESLSIIKDFLDQPLSHQDHQAAISHYFDIALSVEQSKLVFEEGMRILKEIELQEETKHQEMIIKHIIDAALAQKKFDEILKLIELRKEKLPILKQYLATIDLILYKKHIHQPYKDELFSIMNDTIPEDIKIHCLKELYQLYRLEQDHTHAMETLLKLYQYDLKHLYEEDEFELLVHLKKYEEVIDKGHQTLKIDSVKPKVIIALLKSYMALSQYHRAINLEAEYEAYIDSQDEDIKKEAYELLVELYTQENNKLSLNIYQKKLKSLQKTIEKKDIKPKQEEKEPVVIKPLEVKQKSFSGDLIKKFETFSRLVFFSHQIDFKLKMRDYLRMFFIEVASHYYFKECLVYLEQASPNFYFYKKERLYDKNLFENDLRETMIPLIFQTGEEVFDPPGYLKHQNNPITNKSFEDDIKFVYGFPIGEEGVFMVHLDKNIKDPAEFYDDFKLIAQILYTHIIDEKHMESLKNERLKYEKIIQSDVFANRIHTLERSIYNASAKALFGIETHHHLELFLRDVHYDDIRALKETIDYMMTHPNHLKSITYRFQNRTIFEKMMTLKIHDEVMLFSIFEDQSEAVKQKHVLMEKATLDYQTGLLNIHALTEDLDEYLKDKASLLLIELDYDLKHIYGGDLVLQYFKEFCQLTKKFFNEGTTYRKDFNQMVVILPQNDIRAITKIVKDYLKMIQQAVSITLKYEKYTPYLSILRYPVVTSDKKKAKLLHYLDIGLERVKRQKQDAFDFFLYKDYEEEVFEQEVIHYLNEAIENQQLSLVFNQITDIKNNKIWQYESELIVPNLSIASHYLMTLAKKRHRIVDLEKYHIHEVIQFLVRLEKETERLIKITIPISKETFLDHQFNPYVTGLLKRYQIPPEFIRLKLDLDVKGKQAQHILELIDFGIAIDTTALSTALNYPVNALHMNLEKDTLKMQSYFTKLKSLCDQFHMAFVIRGIKNREQKDMIERLGIHYIEGSIYKQLKSDVLISKIKENI